MSTTDTAFDLVIGIEVHCQLKTNSKLFCPSENAFGAKANTNVSPVNLALPGALPVLNKEAVRMAVMAGLALHCDIREESVFARKNYFYPDLPKGYQITQDNLPICVGGKMKFKVGDAIKEIRIHHIHMEEDAGKNSHDLHDKYSLVDINRAGVPLLEIVTEPDLRSADEVHDFIASLQQLVRYLGISDGNMEQGSLRCDVNVSLMPEGSKIYGERCEVKNVNSKKFAREAVNAEVKRQLKLLGKGETILRSTLLYDPARNITEPMRSKEEANDYRYFPDPDLPPIIIDKTFIDEISSEITQLPWTAEKLLIDQFDLSEYDADIISRDIEVLTFFIDANPSKELASIFSSIIINKILPEAGEDFELLQNISTQNLLSFAQLLSLDNVSKSKALNELTPYIIDQGKNLIDINAKAKELNLIQSDDQDFLVQLVKEVIEANPDKVKAYKNGKKGLKGFFMGQVMGKSKGKANPQILEKVLNEHLS